MPYYNCELCNFSTDLRSNFVRHLMTPKHKKRIVDSLGFRTEDQKKEYFTPLLAHKSTQTLIRQKKKSAKFR